MRRFLCDFNGLHRGGTMDLYVRDDEVPKVGERVVLDDEESLTCEAIVVSVVSGVTGSFAEFRVDQATWRSEVVR